MERMEPKRVEQRRAVMVEAVLFEPATPEKLAGIPVEQA